MAVVEGKAKITVDDAQAGQQIEKLEKQARDLRNEIVKLRKEPLVDPKKIKNLQTQLKAVNNETKQIRQQTINYRKTLNNLSGASLKDLNTSYRKLRIETSKLDRTTTKYKKNASNLAKLRAEITKVKREMTGAGTASKGFGASMKNIASQMFAGGGILAAVFAFVSIVKGAFNTMLDFSKSSSNLQAIMGLTKDEMASLTDQAKELGSTTAFTASEVIELQTELAKLGFTQQEIINSTEAVLSLAAATGTELAPAAELAGATLRIFNLDATEMGRVADVLAKSTTISSLSMEKLATILPTVGKTAQIAGVSLEKTAALAGTLTDRGLDASSAATSLRNIFLELSNKGLTWNEAMAKINASTDKNKTSMDLFSIRAASAGVILSETAEDIDDLAESLENATGAAEEMARVMLDNLSGDLTKAKSAWEGFILSIDSGAGVFSRIGRITTQFFTKLFGELTQLNEGASLALIGLKNVQNFEGQLNKFRKNNVELLSEIVTVEEKRAQGNRNLVGSIRRLNIVESKLSEIEKGRLEVTKEEKTQLEFKRDLLSGQIKILNEIIPAQQKQNELVEESGELTEKEAKAIEKAAKERAKANQTLRDQIESMNTQLIQDELLRAQEEERIWFEKEQRKIEISKASIEIKDQAVESLEALHQQKMLDIEIAHNAKIEAEMEKARLLVEEQKLKADEALALAFEQGLLDIEAFEQAKFAIREEFGFVKLGELRNLELQRLQQARDDELLTEREFEAAKFKIKMSFASKWVGAQSQHINLLTDIFANQKQSELDAAGENEEAKLAIMKRFADKEFVLKAAQIVASTAQAIMQAFAQLGPIGGAISAVLLATTGISQLAKANAERQRIKGLESGGKLPVTREQDGRNFNAEYGGKKRGFIHKPTVLVGEKGTEFVVSNKSLQIPRIKRFVSAVDSFQKGNGLKQFNYRKVISSGNNVRGFQEGGFTNIAPTNDVETQSQVANDLMITLISEFRQMREDITEWQVNLKTFVIYEEIEEAGDELNSIKTEVTLE